MTGRADGLPAKRDGDVCLPPNGFITIGKTGACEKGRGGETKAQRSHLGALGLRPAPATAVRGMCGDTFLVQQTAFPAAPTAGSRGESRASGRGGEESGPGRRLLGPRPQPCAAETVVGHHPTDTEPQDHTLHLPKQEQRCKWGDLGPTN